MLEPKIYVFREVGGEWRRVDSQDTQPPTLADFINRLGIIIDDNTQFCRIKRYYDTFTEVIEYRAYGGKITISLICTQL